MFILAGVRPLRVEAGLIEYCNASLGGDRFQTHQQTYKYVTLGFVKPNVTFPGVNIVKKKTENTPVDSDVAAFTSAT